jgi:outer membrane protein OmpA-like peptidoglycan-associated protein
MMNKAKKKINPKEESIWVSLSDMMTGLMIIFMFIAISYILQMQKKQEESRALLQEYKKSKIDLYNDLDSAFRQDFQTWKVELCKDLSIKFTNPEILFESGKTEIRPYFQEILDSFLPRYFDLLLQPQYIQTIEEVRIEGHTDTVPAPQFDNDPYIANVILSQLRSTETLKYFKNMEYYRRLPFYKKEIIRYWLTANGLSYGRTLDADGKLSLISEKPIDNQKSRRVEFRIVTGSEKIVEKIMQ